MIVRDYFEWALTKCMLPISTSNEWSNISMVLFWMLLFSRSSLSSSPFYFQASSKMLCLVNWKASNFSDNAFEMTFVTTQYLYQKRITLTFGLQVFFLSSFQRANKIILNEREAPSPYSWCLSDEKNVSRAKDHRSMLIKWYVVVVHYSDQISFTWVILFLSS